MAGEGYCTSPPASSFLVACLLVAAAPLAAAVALELKLEREYALAYEARELRRETSLHNLINGLDLGKDPMERLGGTEAPVGTCWPRTTREGEEFRGPLSSVGCGWSLVIDLGIVAGLLASFGEHYRPGLFVGSWWPVGMGCTLALAVPGALALRLALEGLEWLSGSLTACPGCGCRRWSWGYTRGFGA